jgi:hypothetical protein
MTAWQARNEILTNMGRTVLSVASAEAGRGFSCRVPPQASFAVMHSRTGCPNCARPALRAGAVRNHRPYPDQPSRLNGMSKVRRWRHLEPRHFNGHPAAPWLCPDQRIVVDPWQVQSLQGNNRAAT